MSGNLFDVSSYVCVSAGGGTHAIMAKVLEL